MNNGMILVVLVFLPFVGGLLAYAVGRKSEILRNLLANIVTVSMFFLSVGLLFHLISRPASQGYMDCVIPEICGFGMTFTLEGFRLIYAAVASLMWMMTTLFSTDYFQHHKNTNRFYLFLLLTFGATMGVFLSADLLTTFVFFEVMSFTSYVWVAQEEDAPSLRAAETYLAVAVIGGLVMLMGLFLLYHTLGTLTIAELLPAAKACADRRLLYTAGVCLLIGFGAKAGAFPLHIWLPKAHPVAPAPASALLSGILTKTGVFGILVVSSNLFLHDGAWGNLILALGVLTMFGGALLAVFSIDLKRTLACSSMSQIGFILVGIGMQGLLGEENALAVHGTFLHMVNHSLIKLVLFMAAGAVYMQTHCLDLNRIRGYGRRKTALKAVFLTGALAIGGIPFFAGYISKTLLHESIVEFGGGLAMHAAEAIFLLSGGLTVAYMTKLYVAIFAEKNTDRALQKKYDAMNPWKHRAAMTALVLSAGILFIWGVSPHTLMQQAAGAAQNLMHLEESGHSVHYFAMQNLSGALISIGIGAVVYLIVIRGMLMKKTAEGRVYVNRWPEWLDMEHLIYRPLLLGFLPFVSRVVCRIFDSLPDAFVVLLRKTIYKDSPLPHELPEGTRLTLVIGKILNFMQKAGNKIRRKDGGKDKDYVHILAVKYAEMKESNMIIQRSLSFGLFMFCIGLCLTLIYIIIF